MLPTLCTTLHQCKTTKEYSHTAFRSDRAEFTSVNTRRVEANSSKYKMDGSKLGGSELHRVRMREVVGPPYILYMTNVVGIMSDRVEL